jgi:taurine dioxygenase
MVDLEHPRTVGYRRITVDPLTPVIGAQVFGADLDALDETTWHEIERAFAKHLVLFFPDQHLSPESHKGLGRRFGQLHVHPAAPSLPGHPEIMIIHADEHSEVVSGNGWHTDVSCDERPPLGTILYLKTLPPAGGDTLFASMYAAYDELSENMKEFLVPLQAQHESRHHYPGRYETKEEDTRDGSFPEAVHPVIRTHPVTGRKALYVNRTFTTRILGLTPLESRSLLDMLFTHQEDPKYQCRFRWQPNSVAIWDNRCTQHYAIWDYFPEVRSGVRVSIIGERPS